MNKDGSGPHLTWPGKPSSEMKIKPGELHALEILAAEDSDKAVNRLIHGDNFGVLDSLIDSQAQSFDLIYLDPPFATGMDFLYNTDTGSKGRIKAKAYKDKWRHGEYLTMMYERLLRIHKLLKPSGALYLHLDYRATHALRFILDEIFGSDNFVNEIIWFYKTGGLPEKLGFGRKHDSILFYAKERQKASWNPQKEKSYLAHKYGFSNITIHEDKGGQYTLVNCRDVFDISALRGNQPERVNYPTQKPAALLERIILASSNPGDLVGDFFCGSGTTLAVAEQHGRRWLGCDQGHWAIQTSRKRLLALDPKPFLLLGEHRFPIDNSIEVTALKKASKGAIFKLESVSKATKRLETGHSELDLIDEWALGTILSKKKPFKPLWSARRSRKIPDLPLETPALTISKADLKKLMVKIVDVYGRVRLAPVTGAL
jgi:DNA modification methylase